MMEPNVDSALTLRMLVDKGISISDIDIKRYLKDSALIEKLTADFTPKPLFAIWKLLALSEIPHTNSLEYTKQVVEYVNKHLANSAGFSLTGKDTDLLPCYNAMLVEALSKLGYAKSESVQNAIAWIKQYQVFDRYTSTTWSGKGILKYGGCFKKTPCFMGIAKTVKALIHYSKAIDNSDTEICSLLNKGVDYILQHNLYKRLSNGESITKHILDISFPASYQLNIVELLEIVYLTDKIREDKCKQAIEYVLSKEQKEGFWKINYAYKADGYISFDSKGKKADWVTYLLNRYLSQTR